MAHGAVAASLYLLATRLDSWNFCQIWRQVICGKILNCHLNQADEWIPKIWFRFAAPIDNHSDCGNDTAVGADDVDCFLNPSTAGHHIFDNDEFFTGRNLKAAA